MGPTTPEPNAPVYIAMPLYTKPHMFFSLLRLSRFSFLQKIQLTYSSNILHLSYFGLGL